MKINHVHIKNFRSIKDLNFWFPEIGLMILVGVNNAGKSNIVRAINNILGESWWGKNIDDSDYYMRDPNNAIEIAIQFDNGREVAFNSSEGWPQYYDENGYQFRSNQRNVKDDFPSTYLAAERSISKTLSFSKWELMGKVAQSFNRLVKSAGKEEALINKFNEVMDILDEIEEFKQFKEDFVRFFTEMQADTPYKLKIDFKPFTPLNYFKTLNILANDETLGDEFDIDPQELGEGTKNLIIFSLLRSYAKNFRQEAQGLLIVEEPEIYLHPQAQRHLLKVFQEIVKNSNIQILITTHSSSFIETEHFENIGLVYKSSEEGTKIRQVSKRELVDFSNLTGARSSSTVENIEQFYAITSDDKLKEAFFAKKVILVEGDTEEICLPELLKDFDLDAQGISIIGVEGKNQLPKYWRLFYKFKIPMLIIFDNDIEKDADKRNNETIANCFDISIEEIEQHFDIYQEFEDRRFNQKLIAFENNFETALQREFAQFCLENGVENRLNEFEREAIRLGLRKAQKSRHVIKLIQQNYPKFSPLFISQIVTFISPDSDRPYSENLSDDFEIPF